MYAKIFSSLFDGSMRGKSDMILVFVNLLSHSDQDGVVDRHWQAISDETGIGVERTLAALTDLEAPDPQSRSEEDQGRRIRRINENRNWGWTITNHRHYRDIVTEVDRRNYMREYMKQRRGSNVNSVLTNVNALSVSESVSKSSLNTRALDFVVFWKAYPRKVGKKKALKAWCSASDLPPLSDVLAALEKQKQSHDWTKDGGDFIPHPTTWINGARWDDQLLPPIQHQPRLSEKEYAAQQQRDIEKEQAAYYKVVDQIKHDIEVRTPEQRAGYMATLWDKYKDVPRYKGKHVVEEAKSEAKSRGWL